MIDIHSHILWGVDDGPKELERSLTMLDLAREDGIDTLIATSHYSKELPSLLENRVNELAPYAEERGIRLLPGTEIDYVHLEETRPLITLAGTRFVLIDMRQPYLEMSAPHVLSQVSLDGYEIIIAHPERLFGEPDLRTVKTLAEMDCLFQINAGSITGDHGSHAQRIAFKLIEKGCAHYVGSDAHSPRRTFRMSAARRLVEKRYGNETAELLFEENARQLLAGEPPFRVITPHRPWYKRLFQ